MKKNLLLLLAGACIFTACNNGPYDADGTTDNSDIPNPYSPSAMTIEFDVNGAHKVFNPSGYVAPNDTKRSLVGTGGNEGADTKRSVNVNLVGYKGVGEYLIAGEPITTNSYFSFTDSVVGDTARLVFTTTPDDTVRLKVRANFETKLVGTFSGSVMRLNTYTGNMTRVQVTNGTFDVPRQ